MQEMNTEAMTVCGWMATVGLGSGGFYQEVFDKFISADTADKLERVSDGAMVDDGVSDGGGIGRWCAKQSAQNDGILDDGISGCTNSGVLNVKQETARVVPGACCRWYK